MKTLCILLLAAGAALPLVAAPAGSPADPPVGRLPDGRYYLQNEVNFALKEPAAQALSAADATRKAVAVGSLKAIHASIEEVVGGHTAARLWLAGQPLPGHLLANGPQVPVIARSLKAKLTPGVDAADVVKAIGDHPDVEWACLNILHRADQVPNDTRWADQWGPPRIRADDAWDVTPASTTRRVAIVDTGVDLTHPDLSSRIVYNAGFGGNANGDAKRDRRGGSSIDHGTHCAGIAAAIRHNSRGIAGTAQVNIMAMGCATWVASASEYYIGSSADAINDAVANSADAISCSFGNSSLDAADSSAYDSAQTAGILIVAAAGNDGMDVDSSPSQGWNDHAWPLIVSNTQSDDTLRASSNTGTAIDLAAPGTSILSTVTTNYYGANVNGNYDYFSGTSMSAPHVAGAAVMVRSMNPSQISGSGIKSLLYRMAEDLGTAGKDTSYGYGILQLDPVFLAILKDANRFASPFGLPVGLATGHFNLPYNTVAGAVSSVPVGGTIVLNAGSVGTTSYSFPGAVTITKQCTLNAFPDHAAVIGR